jgi:hypothetical protein
MEIEDTEKIKKRPTVLSICKRIDFYIADIQSVLDVLLEDQSIDEQSLSQRTLLNLQTYKETYDSIRSDLQKSIELNDEAMMKLFPEIEIDKTNYGHTTDSLFNMIAQLRHMKLYCERLL